MLYILTFFYIYSFIVTTLKEEAYFKPKLLDFFKEMYLHSCKHRPYSFFYKWNVYNLFPELKHSEKLLVN